MRKHIKTALKRNGLILSLLFTSTASLGAASFEFKGEDVHSFTSDEGFACIKPENMKSNSKISHCLNAYGDFILRDQGKVAHAFYNEDPSTPEGKFNEFARIRDFDPSAHTKLSTFKIKVPLTADVDISEGKSCFNYTAFNEKKKTQTILDLKKQIENAADFLSHHHMKSAGSRNSWFFHLSQIEICSSKNFNDRNFVYSRHKLHIALDSKRNKLVTFELPEIVEAWKSDNIIRRVESTFLNDDIYSWVPLIGEKVRNGMVYSKAGKEGVALDLIAEQWDVLNPTGLLRSDIVADLVGGVSRTLKGDGILATLHKKILTDSEDKITQEEEQSIKSELLKITESGPGLRNEKSLIQDLNEQSLKDLYSKYIKTVNDRFTIVEMLENGIKESILGTNPLHNPEALKTFRWSDRVGATAIGATVFNNKEINVFFNGFAPGDALPVQRFSGNEASRKPKEIKAEEQSFIVVTEDEELARKAAEIDLKTLEELKCTEEDSSDVCKIKALSLKISGDSMLYKDDDITLIKYVPGMSYDLNTDKVFTLVGASLDLVDDVTVLASLKLPNLSSGMVQRYSLAKAVRKTALVQKDATKGLDLQ